MAAPTITITNPKRLFKEDFDALRGTTLYEQLFRNRCKVDVARGLNDAKSVARTDIEQWLKENCGTFYYIANDGGWVYIEGDTDAVNFKMRFHDQEVVIPEKPEEPQPKSKPISSPSSYKPSPLVKKRSSKDWTKMISDYNQSGYDDIEDNGLSDELIATLLGHMNNK